MRLRRGEIIQVCMLINMVAKRVRGARTAQPVRTRMQIDGSTVVLTGILARTLLGILFSVFWLRDKRAWLRDKRAVWVPLVERDLLSR
jgi:hypothetical protein